MAEISIDPEKYPSNSRKSKEEALTRPREEHKLEKVITGKVVKRKKPFYKAVGDFIFGKDTESVVSYILYDILIPAGKDLIVDSIKNGVEMRVYGETRNRGSRSNIGRDRGRSYVNYANYGGLTRDRGPERTREPERLQTRSLSHNNWEQIILESRTDAEEVLDRLIDLITMFGVASVSDLCELIDIESDYTDNKYGWTNLSKATVDRVREGWLLNIPKPFPI